MKDDTCTALCEEGQVFIIPDLLDDDITNRPDTEGCYEILDDVSIDDKGTPIIMCNEDEQINLTYNGITGGPFCLPKCRHRNKNFESRWEDEVMELFPECPVVCPCGKFAEVDRDNEETGRCIRKCKRGKISNPWYSPISLETKLCAYPVSTVGGSCGQCNGKRCPENYVCDVNSKCATPEFFHPPFYQYAGRNCDSVPIIDKKSQHKCVWRCGPRHISNHRIRKCGRWRCKNRTRVCGNKTMVNRNWTFRPSNPIPKCLPLPIIRPICRHKKKTSTKA